MDKPATKKTHAWASVFGADEFKVLVPLLIVIAVTGVFRPAFLAWSNLRSLYTTIPYIAIIALGAAFPMMTGNVDISTGRVAGLGGIIFALSISQLGLPWYLSILLSLAVCLVFGMLNAVMVVILNVPDFVATMATLNICGAVRYLILPNSRCRSWSFPCLACCDQ